MTRSKIRALGDWTLGPWYGASGKGAQTETKAKPAVQIALRGCERCV